MKRLFCAVALFALLLLAACGHAGANSFDLAEYAFPQAIDPSAQYLLYLHPKIVEDQGLPAVSTEYGAFDYAAILEKFSAAGFVVISEQRAKDTDSQVYAEKVAGQVQTLLAAGVPEANITVVGASKGGGIALLVSHLVENRGVNYAVLSICSPATVDDLLARHITLHGNVLSLYDAGDPLAGSCARLFEASRGTGLEQEKEIELYIGSGHGILFQPLKEWVEPILAWAHAPQE